MILLKGAEVSSKLKAEVTAVVSAMEGHIPTAAIVRVGERPDDLSYERNAMKKIASFGMEARSFVFPEHISEEEFEREFRAINENPEIDGILLFRPLPSQIDSRLPERMIDPRKDLDGISPINSAKIFAGEKDGFAPCTAEAVMEILKAYEIDPAGKRVVVIGRSMVVGRPLSMLLLNANATVTICHTRTKDLRAVCKEADILVAAAGKAGMVTAEDVLPGTVVIDVGINVGENGKLCGDVKWDGIEDVASAATPVPGGVGSVTTAVLAKHLCMAAARR